MISKCWVTNGNFAYTRAWLHIYGVSVREIRRTECADNEIAHCRAYGIKVHLLRNILHAHVEDEGKILLKVIFRSCRSHLDLELKNKKIENDCQRRNILLLINHIEKISAIKVHAQFNRIIKHIIYKTFNEKKEAAHTDATRPSRLLACSSTLWGSCRSSPWPLWPWCRPRVSPA